MCRKTSSEQKPDDLATSQETDTCNMNNEESDNNDVLPKRRSERETESVENNFPYFRASLGKKLNDDVGDQPNSDPRDSTGNQLSAPSIIKVSFGLGGFGVHVNSLSLIQILSYVLVKKKLSWLYSYLTCWLQFKIYIYIKVDV